jgi:beta-glucuronidase
MKIVYLLLFTLLLQTVHAQTKLIQNINARHSINLDGRWHYIIDRFETGFRGFQGATADENGSLSGFFENRQQQQPGELVEYDFEKSPTLVVPGDWNSQNDELLFYEGTIWYQRNFYVQPKQGKRYILRFGAVNYEAYVSVNGKKAGTHIGGFTPFEFDVTNLLKSGNNYIVIKVDNTRKKEAVPTDNFDWWNYGGITRDVVLAELPVNYIQDYKIQLAKADLKTIAGYVQMSDSAASQSIRINIPEAGLQTTVTTDNNGKAWFHLPIKKLTYWQPENPKLYDVTITNATDTVTDKIGFRTIEVSGKNILLNGKSVFLRGICIHAENPFIPGRPRSNSDLGMLLHWAKELDCNYARLAHYPHDENMSRIADSIGLLLWEEVPVYWTIDWTNTNTYNNAQHQLAELITRDKNRACVIIWSIGNETPNNSDREKFMEGLADYVHATDSTRLVSAALLTSGTANNTVNVNDPLGNKLDVASFNEYYGWYTKEKPWEIGKFNFNIEYNKPVIISEVGADALGGFHADSTVRFSEEYQESFFKNQLPLISKIDGLRGMTPWILVDFRSPKRLNPTYQMYWNRKGLISESGQKKKAFYVLQHFYEEKAKQP